MNDDNTWENSREMDVERSGRAELGSSSEDSWGRMVLEGSEEGAASFANVLGIGGHSRMCIPCVVIDTSASPACCILLEFLPPVLKYKT